MAIEGVEQPEILEINETLRLRRYDGAADFAFAWYQDPELVYLVDGVKRPYDRETLYNMYDYLDQHGELYFIEARAGEGFAPIGDVAFSRTDLPIVIGVPEYRGRGVGRQVIQTLMDRGRQLGFPTLGVREIYDFNIASIRCFTACGFAPVARTDKGWRYEAKLVNGGKGYGVGVHGPGDEAGGQAVPPPVGRVPAGGHRVRSREAGGRPQ